MARAPVADSCALPAFSKAAGDEPLPGYVLLEPLGRGGFGEVWQCVAPGGLHKAIKFVAGAADPGDTNAHQFRQEFEAFQQIRAIRHPFLLTLERVELVGGDLVMVMELADRQLGDRFNECKADRLAGIPRGELLGYLGEAAEALDVIGTQYGLQHLDVKPANLFVTAGHVKVGDYGLVSKLDRGGVSNRGLTPKFVAPEVLRGQVDTRSDQYSLALVYQELLTGSFAYPARTPQQMMMAHVSAEPDLSSLPECDRPAVRRALAKDPADRFPSCLEFIRAMVAVEYTPPPARTGSAPGASGVVPFYQREVTHTPGPGELTTYHTARRSGAIPYTASPGSRTWSVTHRKPTSGVRSLPPLTAADRWPTLSHHSGDTEAELPLAEPEPAARVRVSPIRAVVPVPRLLGTPAPDPDTTATELAAAVAAVAEADSPAPADMRQLADGTWACRFPSAVTVATASAKLGGVCERWGLKLEQAEADRLVLRKTAPAGLWGALSGKKGSLEIAVLLPPAVGGVVREVSVSWALVGTPDRVFVKSAGETVPQLVGDIRRELGNVADRRKAPRLAAAFPMNVYPLHSDGTVEAVVAAQCRDVSVGGLEFSTPDPLPTKHAYVEFGGVMATAGLAVLVKLVREKAADGEHVYGAQYRTDL